MQTNVPYTHPMESPNKEGSQLKKLLHIETTNTVQQNRIISNDNDVHSNAHSVVHEKEASHL